MLIHSFAEGRAGERPHYGLSKTFATLNPGNELYDVLRILKRLSQLVISN